MDDVYDGIDLTVSARLPRQVLIAGGTSTGRERTNDCAFLNQPDIAVGRLVNGAPSTAANGVVSGFAGSGAGISSPNLLEFCDIRPPFQTNVKFLVVYPLPWWGLQTSATFQGLPGPAKNASAAFRSAAIAPSLHRDLAAGANATVVLDMVPPNSRFEDAIKQLNLRFEKSFTAGGGKVRGMVDLFNMFNASPVLALNTRVTPTYPLPTIIMPARMIKFSGQWEF
jgi:hypothetical protein